MLTALVWTGGLGGLLAFIVCTVAAMVAVAAHAWERLFEFLGIALCGAGLAFFANRRIEGERRRRNAQRLQAAARWSGTELTVGLGRAKWLLALGIGVAFTVMGAVLATSSNPKLVVAGAGLCAMFLVVLAGGVVQGLAAARAGFVLRLDPEGIHHCRGVTIPWRDVLALDLRQVTIRNRPSSFLVVVLRPQARVPSAPAMLRLLDWSRPRPARGQVEFPLGAGAADPCVVAEAARVIGARAGVPLASGANASWIGVHA